MALIQIPLHKSTTTLRQDVRPIIAIDEECSRHIAGFQRVEDLACEDVRAIVERQGHYAWFSAAGYDCAHGHGAISDSLRRRTDFVGRYSRPGLRTLAGPWRDAVA